MQHRLRYGLTDTHVAKAWSITDAVKNIYVDRAYVCVCGCTLCTLCCAAGPVRVEGLLGDDAE